MKSLNDFPMTQTDDLKDVLWVYNVRKRHSVIVRVRRTFS